MVWHRYLKRTMGYGSLWDDPCISWSWNHLFMCRWLHQPDSHRNNFQGYLDKAYAASLVRGETISLVDIKQIFTKEKMHRNKNSISYSYEVHFLDHQGKETKMVSGLEKPEQALYIEQEIESTLGIKDAPVSGELPRR